MSITGNNHHSTQDLIINFSSFKSRNTLDIQRKCTKNLSINKNFEFEVNLISRNLEHYFTYDEENT